MKRRKQIAPKARDTKEKANIISSQEAYDAARRRSLALLKLGLDLGSHGNLIWSREDLHDR